MLISDWSLDVCSSDLRIQAGGAADFVSAFPSDTTQRDRPRQDEGERREARDGEEGGAEGVGDLVVDEGLRGRRERRQALGVALRSEERRAGHEGVSTGRTRWCPYH